MLTSTQIASAIRRKLLEQSPDIVTDDVLYMNMNLAYLDLKLKTFTNDQIESATVALVNGVGALPTNFGTLYGSSYANLTDTTPYQEKSIADFDSAPYDYGVTVEGGQLKVSPSSTTSIRIKYWKNTSLLTTVQDPTINEAFHELIIYGGLYRIHQDLQNESLAQFYRELYKEEFADRQSAISNYQEDNNRGGQMFNGRSIL